MSNKTEKTTEAKDDGKTVIRPDTENYTKAKAASGASSMHNGDPVALALAGATLEEAFKLAAEVCDVTQKEMREKYAHLNQGQQRMNAGNRIRGVVNKLNKAEAGSGDKFITELASGIREGIDKRNVAAALAKVKADKAAADKAEAKKAADAKKVKAAAEKKAA